MTTDFRALCANLTAALNDWQCETGDDRYEGLLDRARALLAQEAVGPSEKELYDLFCEHAREPVESMRAALARWGRPAAAPVPGPTDEALANFTAWFCRNYPGPDTLIHRPEWHAPKVFRAAADAIARWGRPAAAPVPEPGEVPRIGHILRLAEIIREVDGRHDKGAAALAEAILSHPGICSAGLAALDEAVSERLPGPSANALPTPEAND